MTQHSLDRSPTCTGSDGGGRGESSPSGAGSSGARFQVRAVGRSSPWQRQRPRRPSAAVETGEPNFQEPSRSGTGSDTGGSRRRILVGRARWRSRPGQGRCPRQLSVTVETGENPIQQPYPSGTGSDTGGSRRRILVGRARWRSRPGQGWCPRRSSVAVETGENPIQQPCPSGIGSDTGGAVTGRQQTQNSRHRAVRPSCPAASDRTDRSGIMMTPTAAQADHY